MVFVRGNGREEERGRALVYHAVIFKRGGKKKGGGVDKGVALNIFDDGVGKVKKWTGNAQIPRRTLGQRERRGKRGGGKTGDLIFLGGKGKRENPQQHGGGVRRKGKDIYYLKKEKERRKLVGVERRGEPTHFRVGKGRAGGLPSFYVYLGRGRRGRGKNSHPTQ